MSDFEERNEAEQETEKQYATDAKAADSMTKETEVSTDKKEAGKDDKAEEKRKANTRTYALSAEGRKAKQVRCSSFPITFPYAMTVCIRRWIPSVSLIIREC